MATIDVGELLYEVDGTFTKVVAFGITMDELLAGGASVPPEGARFDISFEGTVHGTKVTGSVSGVDYINIRADGRAQLHIHAVISTRDGANIAFFGDGVMALVAGRDVAEIRENGTFTTSAPAYAFLNKVQAWVRGTVDLAKGRLQLKAYAA